MLLFICRSRGKAHTQLSLVPRSLQQQASKPDTSAAAVSPAAGNGESNEAAKLPAPMSNSDFRSMLLRK